MAPRHRDVIVVGASAGGVEALRTLVSGIPPELAAAVAVVLHLPAGGTSALPQILRRFGSLPAVSAASGMPLRRGVIHVAPPVHMAERMRHQVLKGASDRIVERYTRMAEEAREAADLLRSRLTTISLKAEHEAEQ